MFLWGGERGGGGQVCQLACQPQSVILSRYQLGIYGDLSWVCLGRRSTHTRQRKCLLQQARLRPRSSSASLFFLLDLRCQIDEHLDMLPFVDVGVE